INNTIVDNNAENGGGMYFSEDSDPTLTNNIIWDNTASNSGAQIYLAGTQSDPDFYYCDIQDGRDGIEGPGSGGNYQGYYENNLDADPLFLGLGWDYPYGLRPNSPCIDAGQPDTTGLNLPEMDLAGNHRLRDGIVDMGAYEFFLFPGYLFAHFSADVQGGAAPLTVQFSDFSATDPDYPITSWAWDFDNDGVVDSNEQHPTWVYEEAGIYTVQLIVTNSVITDRLTMADYIYANGGFLVWEGEENGVNYSGSFIRDVLLTENPLVFYTTIFPPSLLGFEAAFLSFGNSGADYVYFAYDKATLVQEYLESGGRVYLEGGDALYDQRANGVLLTMFGLVTVYTGWSNLINQLEGQPGALTEGMLFTDSAQPDVNSIDVYWIDEYGKPAFIKDDYIFAVQNTGEYNQKTFCFSYALAYLVDGEPPNTRTNLLMEIVEFFLDDTGIEDDTASIPLEFQLNQNYPNPFNPSTTIQFALPNSPLTKHVLSGVEGGPG
ncbi:MAG: PKD domain-containing protein, partial [Planctomycetes bacterium]|nr:PKD domain-containing protein [Planctomycetota bacterium]